MEKPKLFSFEVSNVLFDDRKYLENLYQTCFNQLIKNEEYEICEQIVPANEIITNTGFFFQTRERNFRQVLEKTQAKKRRGKNEGARFIQGFEYLESTFNIGYGKEIFIRAVRQNNENLNKQRYYNLNQQKQKDVQDIIYLFHFFTKNESNKVIHIKMHEPLDYEQNMNSFQEKSDPFKEDQKDHNTQSSYFELPFKQKLEQQQLDAAFEQNKEQTPVHQQEQPALQILFLSPPIKEKQNQQNKIKQEYFDQQLDQQTNLKMQQQNQQVQLQQQYKPTQQQHVSQQFQQPQPYIQSSEMQNEQLQNIIKQEHLEQQQDQHINQMIQQQQREQLELEQQQQQYQQLYQQQILKRKIKQELNEQYKGIIEKLIKDKKHLNQQLEEEKLYRLEQEKKIKKLELENTYMKIELQKSRILNLKNKYNKINNNDNHHHHHRFNINVKKNQDLIIDID